MPRTPRLPWPRTADDGTSLGIDVAAKAEDIRRLTIAGYSLAAVESRVGIEDLVQTVFEAILRRNHFEASAFDPRRGSFGHYVHRLAGCQLANLVGAARRNQLAEEDAPEVVDAEAFDPEGQLEEVSAGVEELRAAEGVKPLWKVALEERRAKGPQLGLFGPGVMSSSSVAAPSREPARYQKAARPPPRRRSPTVCATRPVRVAPLPMAV